MFGQTFAPADLATIALLAVLEILLSIDNALVLSVLARRLEPGVRVKALYYGLLAGIALRLIAIAAAAVLLRFSIIELLGGLYLLWISVRYFLGKPRQHSAKADQPAPAAPSLWRGIVGIELTDLAFAADSVLAAVALVGPAPPNTTSLLHPKYWVIATGGILGIITMRLAAVMLSKILERFPRLHRSAYQLVFLIGAKLVVDWAVNDAGHPHRIDFQNPARIEMWIFWGCALVCLLFGLRRQGAK
jgi:YkoY family integral membrane protein